LSTDWEMIKAAYIGAEWGGSTKKASLPLPQPTKGSGEVS